jgi:hypothetical protein
VFQLEIFELNQHFGIPTFDGSDKLLHKIIIILSFQPRLFDSQIIRIIDQLLISGSDIQTNRQNPSRVESSSGHIQIQFSNRNLKSSDSQVSQAEHSAAISHDYRVYVGFRPVVDHRCHF